MKVNEADLRAQATKLHCTPWSSISDKWSEASEWPGVVTYEGKYGGSLAAGNIIIDEAPWS